MRNLKKLGLGLTASAAVLVATPAGALTIVLNNTGGVTAGTSAFTGFTAAAHFWEKLLTNNVTVNLNVGFTSTGFSSPNVIGSTGSAQVFNVSNVETFAALAATGNSQLDAIAIANLPGLNANGALAAITQKAKPDGTGVLQNVKVAGVETVSNREFDADDSLNNTALRFNTSVYKAIGGEGLPANFVDAAITFNSAFAFDFDPNDGVGVGQIDFIGTAIHEIGHALGFTSGVDVYDANSNFGGNFDNRSNMSTLDLFRYSANPGGLGMGGPTLDWSVGNAVGGRPYFSFDGGGNGLLAYGGGDGFYSTGRNFGDGNQASHWQDTPYQVAPGDQGPGGLRCITPIGGSKGIMDPTFGPCEEGIVRGLDLAAFDAMGWNIAYDVLKDPTKTFTSGQALSGFGIPEPATWLQMILGFGLLGGAIRRVRVRRVEYATA